MSDGLAPKIPGEPSEVEYRGGFLHAWMNGHFKTLDDGKRVFYPLGPTGRKGYVVTSTDQELTLRINVRGCQRLISVLVMVVMFSLIFSMESLASWVLISFVFGGWLLAWLLARTYFWRFTRAMESVDVPNSFIAYAQSMGRTVNPTLLIVQFMFAGAISGFTFFVAYQQRDPLRLVLGLVVAATLTPYAIALWSWLRTWLSLNG